LKKLKKKKAEGIDEIPVKILKQLGEKAANELFEIYCELYDKGQWPNDFIESIIIPIEKKAGAEDCSDYRTLSLISPVSKILIRIIAERLENKAKMYLGDQYGFRREVGTRDAIGVMYVLTERYVEHNLTIYVGFVDYEKAFDRMYWKKMMEILNNIGVDWNDRRLIKELYMNKKARVRINNILSEECEIGEEIDQDADYQHYCILYDEAMIKKTVKGEDLGLKVEGECIHSVRFTDDKAMLSKPN